MIEAMELWRLLLTGGILLITALAGGAWVRLARVERDLRRVESIVTSMRDALVKAGLKFTIVKEG